MVLRRRGVLICVCLIVCCLNSLNVNARSRTPPSICLQPPPRSEGVCTIEIEGYYFDQRSNDCLMYVVGGCRSSAGQSFGNRQDCLATCVHGTRRIQDLHLNDSGRKLSYESVSQ